MLKLESMKGYERYTAALYEVEVQTPSFARDIFIFAAVWYDGQEMPCSIGAHPGPG